MTRPVSPQPQSLKELVYDADVMDLIVERWPNAVITDASDFIHEGRFEVEIPDLSKDEFYGHAIVEGWARACFGFELCVRMPERHDDVRRWIDRAESIKEAAT